MLMVQGQGSGKPKGVVCTGLRSCRYGSPNGLSPPVQAVLLPLHGRETCQFLLDQVMLSMLCVRDLCRLELVAAFFGKRPSRIGHAAWSEGLGRRGRASA